MSAVQPIPPSAPERPEGEAASQRDPASAAAPSVRGEAEAAVLGKMTGMSAEALEREFRAELTRRFARYDKQYLPPQPSRADRSRLLTGASCSTPETETPARRTDPARHR